MLGSLVNKMTEEIQKINLVLERIEQRLTRIEEDITENKKIAEGLNQHTWILERLGTVLQSPGRLLRGAYFGTINDA